VRAARRWFVSTRGRKAQDQRVRRRAANACDASRGERLGLGRTVEVNKNAIVLRNTGDELTPLEVRAVAATRRGPGTEAPGPIVG
jgi:hypothetical protein